MVVCTHCYTPPITFFNRRHIVSTPMFKLLLVEDDAMLRNLVSRRLEREGYSVVTANNGAEAILRARREHPHLILMDLGLPLINGFQAVTRIKAEISNIPIIALTAFSINDRAAALAAGCDEYETKPIVFERLLSKIATLLKHSISNADGRS
jgi:two-component system, cell cycle response regulator DivK